uniref:DUF1273 family protein n=1 Tax=Heterorhabditis bacteriophora TaxID=37862 RepID=A0A1I7XBT8_HETBA
MDTSKNEVPYKFNFAKVPAIVFFLAKRRDISWKFPETLPISRSNLLSFLLSRCSPELKWRTAIGNCGKMCFACFIYFPTGTNVDYVDVQRFCFEKSIEYEDAIKKAFSLLEVDICNFLP